MLQRVALVALLATLLVPAFAVERVSTDEKGSVIVFPKVELRWDPTGTILRQDTFIDITNDYPGVVKVLLFFVSEPCTVIENDIVLTGHEPMFFSCYDGGPGTHSNGFVTPFTALGAKYLDPEGSGEQVLRGYIVGFAVNEAHHPIRWNNLFGQATLVNYYQGDAWEYNAYTFAAIPGVNGDEIGTTGQLDFDGTMYTQPFSTLLLDFIATGSVAFSGGGISLTHDTDLALLILDQDLRQGGEPYTTKVDFSIWNQNELSIGTPHLCLTKWAEFRLPSVSILFTSPTLGTDKGYCWIYGVRNVNVCPDSRAMALLGVQAKKLTFPAGFTVSAGEALFGFGSMTTSIRYDLLPGGGEKGLNMPQPQFNNSGKPSLRR